MAYNWLKATRRGLAMLLGTLMAFTCLGGALAEDSTTAGSFFDNEEINRLIDENYQEVLEKGYAELRIPLALHNIAEAQFTQNSLEAGRKLLENGFEAYIVGGCIRDFIMGTESNDIDITTNATLEQQLELFGDMLVTHTSGGRTFGGIQFPDELVDLATYQNVPAPYYGMAGVPDFDPSTNTSDSLVLDSFQRDLTMNALYYDLSNGDLVDFHGGIHDIREHILNTMVNPADELAQDARVIVRAVRFKARYGFDFSERLDSAIRERGAELLETVGRHDMLSNVSKMMDAGYSVDAWHALRDYGLLDTVYPPLIRLADDAGYADYLEAALSYMDQLREDLGENIPHTLALLAFLQPEIDRRAERSTYSVALHGVLDEQEMSFDLDDIREATEEISLLEHDMEQADTNDMADIVCDSEYFRDALALLNMKALTDEALAEQAEFWNEAAQMADEDALDAAA